MAAAPLSQADTSEEEVVWVHKDAKEQPAPKSPLSEALALFAPPSPQAPYRRFEESPIQGTNGLLGQDMHLPGLLGQNVHPPVGQGAAAPGHREVGRVPP